MSSDSPRSTMTNDWSHACEQCSFVGWGVPEINAKGEHLNPDGGTCDGLIVASPPPTVEGTDPT